LLAAGGDHFVAFGGGYRYGLFRQNIGFLFYCRSQGLRQLLLDGRGNVDCVDFEFGNQLIGVRVAFRNVKGLGKTREDSPKRAECPRPHAFKHVFTAVQSPSESSSLNSPRQLSTSLPGFRAHAAADCPGFGGTKIVPEERIDGPAVGHAQPNPQDMPFPLRVFEIFELGAAMERDPIV